MPLGHLQTYQHPNHRGARRRTRRARNWKVTWKNNERKLPQFGKGNRHTSLGSSKQVGPKKDRTPRHIILKCQKLNIREYLKSSKRKGESYLQRSSHKAISWFLKRDLIGRKGLARSIRRDKKQGPTSMIILSSKAIIWNGRADKVPPRQGKAKGVHHQALIIWNVKGS